MTPRLLARLDQIAAGWCGDATCRASLDETDAACAGDDPSSQSQASESEGYSGSRGRLAMGNP